jgi:hypothetical protein
MSEAPFNPVAPALANAVRDATGRRLTELPLTRDRVFSELTAVLPGAVPPGAVPPAAERAGPKGAP